MKTTFAKPNSVQKRWFVVDAAGQVLGRLATELAMLLRGKRSPGYTPHADTGDCVVVVNVDKIRVTGKKMDQKCLKRYSGYPGGLKHIPYSTLMATRPEEILRHAVWGMLPHTVMGRRQLTSLKIYRGVDHPHEAQSPAKLKMEKGSLVRA